MKKEGCFRKRERWLPWPAWRCRRPRGAARPKQRQDAPDVMESPQILADTLSHAMARRRAAISETPAFAATQCSFASVAPRPFCAKEHLGAQGISTRTWWQPVLVRARTSLCPSTVQGRVMFPITDVRGRVIAFGGRRGKGVRPIPETAETPGHKAQALKLAPARQATHNGSRDRGGRLSRNRHGHRRLCARWRRLARL